MNCKYCHNPCIKAGFQRSGLQKFLCKACRKYQQSFYRSEAYDPGANKRIVHLLTEGVSLRSIARLLCISLKTVIERIKRIARSIHKPVNYSRKKIYKFDELWTYLGKKSNEVWITYSIERPGNVITDFKVGPRTKENLERVTRSVLALNPERIRTDGLNTYRSLIPEEIHRVGLPHTRHIERFNLTLRAHMKRLNRKTICFSKTREMPEACLRIYFWRNRSDDRLRVLSFS